MSYAYWQLIRIKTGFKFLSF